jgi:hypothetical protein
LRGGHSGGCFSIWTAYRGGQFFDYSAILFGYLSASLLILLKTPKTNDLLVGCFAAIVAVLNTVMFFVQG